jgi:Ice-binding-like/Bacterial Ig-like domain (group 3)
MIPARIAGTIRARTALSRLALALALTLAAATAVVMGITGAAGAKADAAPVSLGTAANYAVLAGSTVTNTGATTIAGSLGLSPGTAVTGFPPGQVEGSIDAANSAALQAQNDLTAAYNAAAASPVTATIPVELGGTTETPGVYASPAGTFGITGTLTLDAQGDPNAVFIFEAASTLITASASNVVLVNGAQASNVFWKVGSSATLGTYSILRGNVLAQASITVTTGATLDGRALARTAAVTLDSDTITPPTSIQAPTNSTTSLATSINPVPAGQPVTLTATVTPGTGTAIPAGLVAFSDGSALLGVAALNDTGTAAFTTSALAVGLYQITAYYIGAGGFESSNSPGISELVGWSWPASGQARKVTGLPKHAR